MAVVTTEVIQATKTDCLGNIADLEDSIELMQPILSVHPEVATAGQFAQLRTILHRHLESKQRMLRAMVKVCDALLRERGEA